MDLSQAENLPGGKLDGPVVLLDKRLALAAWIGLEVQIGGKAFVLERDAFGAQGAASSATAIGSTRGAERTHPALRDL